MSEELTDLLGLDTVGPLIPVPIRKSLVLVVRGLVTGEVGTPIGIARAVHADMAREGDAAIPARSSVELRIVRALARGSLNPERILPVVVNRAMQAVLASATEAHDRTAVAREVVGFRGDPSSDTVDLFHGKGRMKAQGHSHVSTFGDLRIHIDEVAVGAMGNVLASRLMCGPMAVPVVAMRWTDDDHMHVDARFDAIFHVIAQTVRAMPATLGDHLTLVAPTVARLDRLASIARSMNVLTVPQTNVEASRNRKSTHSSLPMWPGGDTFSAWKRRGWDVGAVGALDGKTFDSLLTAYLVATWWLLSQGVDWSGATPS